MSSKMTRPDYEQLLGELREHLAMMVRYLEEETRAGDGICEEHYDGYMAAKRLLEATATEGT